MPGWTITILAAASLVDVMPKLAAEWSKDAGVQVVFSFDASSRLAKQAENGAPADCIVTADNEWMDYLEKSRALAKKTRVTLARNRLVAVAPDASKLKAADALALSALSIRRLALAGESVPAGRYARQALDRASVYGALEPAIVRGDTVRTVLRWVAEREADVGVVYASDASSEPRVRVLFTFPSDTHSPIVYPGAVLAQSAHQDSALKFLQYCASPRARRIWREAGFPE
jgi:molybdate transport system substrate-binding protein